MVRKTVFALLVACLMTTAALAGDLPRAAGELSFKSLDGKQINLADYKGKVVGVMFFSTDCPHCQRTAELLAPIYAQYHGKGFEMLGLAVNPSAAGNLAAFKSQHNVAFPLGLSTRQQWTGFGQMPLMGRHYVPHMLFIDKQGNVVEDHPGGDRAFWLDQEAKIREAIEKLL